MLSPFGFASELCTSGAKISRSEGPGVSQLQTNQGLANQHAQLRCYLMTCKPSIRCLKTFHTFNLSSLYMTYKKLDHRTTNATFQAMHPKAVPKRTVQQSYINAEGVAIPCDHWPRKSLDVSWQEETAQPDLGKAKREHPLGISTKSDLWIDTNRMEMGEQQREIRYNGPEDGQRNARGAAVLSTSLSHLLSIQRLVDKSPFKPTRGLRLLALHPDKTFRHVDNIIGGARVRYITSLYYFGGALNVVAYILDPKFRPTRNLSSILKSFWLSISMHLRVGKRSVLSQFLSFRIGCCSPYI